MTADPVWSPDPQMAASSAIARFARLVQAEHGPDLSDYADLHRWSVDHLESFWAAIWTFFDVQADGTPVPVLGDASMPGAQWFPDARLNYAEHALRHALIPELADAVAVTEVTEAGAVRVRSWRELRSDVGAFAAWLRAAGVEPGDRVVGYLPNCLETIIAFLACASVGAVWSGCGQDYSAAGAAARFGQLEPVLLIAADGYRWNGRDIDRHEEVKRLQAALPTLRATVHLPYLGRAAGAGSDAVPPDAVPWAETIAAEAEPVFARVPFADPLWVLFSSGTTGKPKGIVHGHGGVLLEHLKFLGLHGDLGPGRPLFWYTTTNWMMWNVVASALLVGAPTVLYDGSPGHPSPDRLWRIADEQGVAMLGVSPGYLTACAKAELEPGATFGLDALRTLGVTGAPLAAAAYRWVKDAVGERIQVASTSGGTDIVSAFAGSAPITPVWPGELSAPSLGVALEAWDERGHPLIGAVGELVVTRPMPSMPVRFWNDPDGVRYREAYFDTYPGVWRHGDWVEITDHGSVIVSGRSDATLNRNGVRLGSADIYSVVDRLPQIVDSLVVGVETASGGYWLALFVVLTENIELTEDLVRDIRATIAMQTSPRHVPDDVIAVPAIPHTRTGKKLEVPVKRIIQGHPLDRVAGAEAVDNPAALEYFLRWAGHDPARRDR